MQHDVIIIGGGFAGLAAATYLARARRRVLVIDSGKPRNRFAAASHGFLSRDGSNPGAMLATAREQLLAYPTTNIVEGEAIAARGGNDGFVVELAAGETIAATKLVLAFGLRDRLPDVPGLAERWGSSVIHCPYCHGYEFSDRPLGVLYRTPMSAHQAQLVAEWGPTTLYLNGAELPDAESAAGLAARGVRIESGAIARLTGPEEALESIEMQDGRQLPVEALYVSPDPSLNSPIAEQLGCAIEATPLGPIVRTDGFKMTNVAGVYAAGDIARAPHSVSWAVADGVTAGTAVHRELVFG